MSAETSFGIGLVLLTGFMFFTALGSFVHKVGLALERIVIAWRTRGGFKK